MASFLQVEGIHGGSKSKSYLGYLDILSFRFDDPSDTVVGTTGTGRSGSKVVATSFTVTRQMDSVSTVLSEAIAHGKTFPSGKVVIESSSGPARVAYAFKTLMPTGINWGGSDRSPPTEVVWFSFGSVSVEYISPT